MAHLNDDTSVKEVPDQAGKSDTRRDGETKVSPVLWRRRWRDEMLVGEDDQRNEG